MNIMCSSIVSSNLKVCKISTNDFNLNLSKKYLIPVSSPQAVEDDCPGSREDCVSFQGIPDFCLYCSFHVFIKLTDFITQQVQSQFACSHHRFSCSGQILYDCLFTGHGL